LKHSLFEIPKLTDYTISEINEMYNQIKSKSEELINEGKFREYLMSLPKYSRLGFFESIIKKPTINVNFWDIEDREYWEFLRLLWIENTDEIFGHRDTWYRLFSSSRGQKECFMNESERCFLFNYLKN
jgi:hypothetical protein